MNEAGSTVVSTTEASTTTSPTTTTVMPQMIIYLINLTFKRNIFVQIRSTTTTSRPKPKPSTTTVAPAAGDDKRCKVDIIFFFACILNELV